MLSFERLIETMDHWSSNNPAVRVFAQIGNGRYEPRHMAWTRLLNREEFDARIAAADLVVGHAGMGTVFSAMEHRKPVGLVPRDADTREHTTVHPVHTANWLRGRSGIVIAERNDDISTKIREALRMRGSLGPFSNAAAPDFLDKLRNALLR